MIGDIAFGSVYYQNGAGNDAQINGACKLTPTKIAIAFCDSIDLKKGKVVIGTIASEDEITFGSEYTFETGEVSYTCGLTIERLSDTSFVIAYGEKDTDTYITGVVCTVAGSVVTVGTPLRIDSIKISTSSIPTVIARDANNCIFTYCSPDPSVYKLIAKLGSITDTTLTVGNRFASSVAGNGLSLNNSSSLLSSTKFVTSYIDGGGGYPNYWGKSIIADISGTTINWATAEYSFHASNMGIPSGYWKYLDVTAIDSTHFVIAYRSQTANVHGACKVGTVSNTVISYGSEYSLETTGNYPGYFSIEKLDTNKFIVVNRWRDETPQYVLRARVGLVTGSSISYYTAINAIAATTTCTHSPAVLDSTHFALPYRDLSGAHHGATKIGVVEGGGMTATINKSIISLSPKAATFGEGITASVNKSVISAVPISAGVAAGANASASKSVIKLVPKTAVAGIGITANVNNAVIGITTKTASVIGSASFNISKAVISIIPKSVGFGENVEIAIGKAVISAVPKSASVITSASVDIGKTVIRAVPKPASVIGNASFNINKSVIRAIAKSVTVSAASDITINKAVITTTPKSVTIIGSSATPIGKVVIRAIPNATSVIGSASIPVGKAVIDIIPKAVEGAGSLIINLAKAFIDVTPKAVSVAGSAAVELNKSVIDVIIKHANVPGYADAFCTKAIIDLNPIPLVGAGESIYVTINKMAISLLTKHVEREHVQADGIIVITNRIAEVNVKLERRRRY